MSCFLVVGECGFLLVGCLLVGGLSCRCVMIYLFRVIWGILYGDGEFVVDDLNWNFYDDFDWIFVRY